MYTATHWLIRAAVETYDQALAWLDADATQADDTIVALYGVKVSRNLNSTCCIVLPWKNASPTVKSRLSDVCDF